MEVGLSVQVGLLVQMGALMEVRSLVVQERIPPQRAHPAVAQHGLSWSLADTIHPQTDGCACHDGRLQHNKRSLFAA